MAAQAFVVSAQGEIRIAGLTKQYGTAKVLDNLSLSIAPGEVVALLGPSGAGKTTLFRCITRLAVADAGEILVSGRPMHRLAGGALAEARREIGLIFQQFNLVRRLSACDNVLVGRLGRIPTWRVLLRTFAQVDRQQALSALDRVGLLGHAYQRADSLSGGQQQRVAIARVIAQNSHVILADEPVASLDPETALRILSLLRDVARERNITVVCSLHQVDYALNFADRIVGLTAGRISVDGTASAFGSVEHREVYGGRHLQTAAAIGA